ncbi:hypothetical protein HID58_014743 [Brassica napus]|uniref:Uncharacterized protein n=2 Tax=Brassica TaxID=3705 RepID=A0ABQ8DKJ8_BRANA|nr:hypothetical protein HID58_014743 [Brassica napus]VDD11815.1 unnamed protein product [Brassica rapa]
MFSPKQSYKTAWALNVYFNNLTEVNLDLELTRRWRITSSSCGREVALLGCYNASCKNTYAKLMPGCRWDNRGARLRGNIEKTEPQRSRVETKPRSKEKIGLHWSREETGLPPEYRED